MTSIRFGMPLGQHFSRVSTFVQTAPCNLNAMRLAGGGGRPGGRPAFNWKEKMALRIANKQAKKEIKVRPFGSLLDLEPHFDANRGDKIIDLSTVKPGFTIEAVNESSNSSKKTIAMQMLFGSNKSYGLIPRKDVKGRQRFSHSRIFGKESKKMPSP
jgi:hypothetical protein